MTKKRYSSLGSLIVYCTKYQTSPVYHGTSRNTFALLPLHVWWKSRRCWFFDTNVWPSNRLTVCFRDANISVHDPCRIVWLKYTCLFCCLWIDKPWYEVNPQASELYTKLVLLMHDVKTKRGKKQQLFFSNDWRSLFSDTTLFVSNTF